MTRSPIELLWTAKNDLPCSSSSSSNSSQPCLCSLLDIIHGSQQSGLFPVDNQFVINSFEINLNTVLCVSWYYEHDYWVCWYFDRAVGILK